MIDLDLLRRLQRLAGLERRSVVPCRYPEYSDGMHHSVYKKYETELCDDKRADYGRV